MVDHTADGTDAATWALDLADPDLDIPGWLLVPPLMDDVAQTAWLDEVSSALDGVETWEGVALDRDAVREVLVTGVEQRNASDALAVLQVWPTLAGQAAVAYIDVQPSEGLPDWTDVGDDGEAVVQPLTSPHLGPGLHLVTRRVVPQRDGGEAEVASALLVFDDGAVTVLFGLDEVYSPLLTANLPGLVELMRNVRVVSATSGADFVAVAPPGLVDTDEWDLEGTA